MRRLAALALVGAVLVLAGTAFADSELRSGRGPFILTGTFQGGASSGFWGDRSSARTGDELGCRFRRHYSFAVVVRNRSAGAVTVTGASGPNPVPHVVARVAMQVRHAPAPQPGDAPVQPLIKHWSAAPVRPVTIKPGRSAIVQSDFLMRHCAALAHGRRVVVPGSFVLSYRVSGRSEQQHFVQQNAGFSVIAGPIVRICARMPGSVSLTSYNIGCATASDAAPACHRMSHGTWGSCWAAGRKWDCDLHSSWVQQCFFPDRTSRWYRVRWVKQPGTG